MLKLANRQTWAVIRLLTALQVKALFTQGCSRTHCTPQALLNAEGEPYCWVMVGWKCRGPWEPWSCMSVPWSLPHLLSLLPPMRRTPGSLGLVQRSSLHHQSNCQYYNRFLPHKEVHHQSPGCCCHSFCRKIRRETGCHQRRVCSLRVRASNREMCFPGSALALLIRHEIALSKLLYVFVSVSPSVKWRVILPYLTGETIIVITIIAIAYTETECFIYRQHHSCLEALTRLQKLKNSRGGGGIQLPEGCWLNHHPPHCSSTFSVRPN